MRTYAVGNSGAIVAIIVPVDWTGIILMLGTEELVSSSEAEAIVPRRRGMMKRITILMNVNPAGLVER